LDEGGFIYDYCTHDGYYTIWGHSDRDNNHSDHNSASFIHVV
jgi:hypothetical protein